MYPLPATRNPPPAKKRVGGPPGAGSGERAAITGPGAPGRRYRPQMPVMVVGADTELGRVVAAALTARDGEVRAFVTDPSSADPLRALGIKVAVGDVSDASHIEGAAHDVFSAVLLSEAASDDRERSFAASFVEVVCACKQGVIVAGAKRILWIGPVPMPGSMES